jgi:2'-5' RNA ligase
LLLRYTDNKIDRKGITPMETDLTPTYAALWQEARSAFLSGSEEIDPRLRDRRPDARRGLTVIFRPQPAVAAQVAGWLGELGASAADQYFYTPGQLHVTVLSLFTATPEYAPFFARLPCYLAALDAALGSLPHFAVAFRGITASPAAVMVQGFPADGTLEHARTTLRAALTQAGLGGDLDRRYRLTTAHLSAMRLRASLADPARFVAQLDAARSRDFGVTQVDELLLVANDWYMTPGVVEVVRRYPLTSTQPV